MFINYGSIFSDTVDKIKELENALKNEGVDIAFSNPNGGVIIREEPDPVEENEEVEEEN